MSVGKVETNRSGSRRDFSSGGSSRKQLYGKLKSNAPLTEKEVLSKEEEQIGLILNQNEKGKPKNHPLRTQGHLSVVEYIEARLITRKELLDNRHYYVLVNRLNGEQGGSIVAQQSLTSTQMDPHMGHSSVSNSCATCYPAKDCPGHTGYIDLGDPLVAGSLEPYIHPLYVAQVKSLYNLVCKYCGSLLLSQNEYNREKFDLLPASSRLRAMEKYLDENARKTGEVKCDSLRSGKIEGVKPIANTPFKSCAEANELAVLVKDGGYIMAPINKKQSYISNKFIYSLFDQLQPDQQKMLGFTKVNPRDLILSFVTIIPPFMRDYITGDGDEGRRDEIEKQIIQLIKEVNIAKNNPDMTVEEQRAKIHDRIFHLFSSKKGKPTRRSNVEESKGYKEKTSGKGGIIRSNMTGKRKDRSARAVMDGDATMRLGEVGVPEFIYNNSTDYLDITEHTRPYIMELYKKGELIHYIPAAGKYRRQRIDMSKLEKNGKKVIFKNGDQVTTRLREGKWLIMNRNPSIHKVSMLSSRLRRVAGNSIRMHNSITTAFNLDYDGDEGNLDIPLDAYEICECKYLLSPAVNLVNTENSSAIIGLVMDGITSMYYLTSTPENGYKEFTVTQYNECIKRLTTLEKKVDGRYMLDQRLAKYDINKYSSRGLLSVLFPPSFYYTSTTKDGVKVLIKDGILVSGKLTSQQVGPVRNSIAQAIYNIYGGDRAITFINDGMAICDYIMTTIEGLSIGFDDAAPNNKEIDKITLSTVRTAQNYVDRLLSTQGVLSDKQSIERIENDITSFLQSRVEAVGVKTTKELLPRSNTFKTIINGGAKGNLFHLSQMITSGGQQFEIGNRIMMTMSDRQRVSAYEKINDTSIESRGFIVNSLGKGFNPREELYHHIATRVSLVDTASKTVDVGEYHHLENKALLDLHVTYASTLVDANGMIVQFIPGGNGLNPFRIVNITSGDQSFGFNINVQHIVETANSIARFDKEKLWK
jgi:DNA-directed RNA polymerase beta' subunit